MSERYSRLFSLPENLYTEGAPVVITAGALLKDNQTGNVLAQLKLQNIDNRVIKAATVQIFPKDTAGDTIEENTTYQYLDLSAGRDTFFGQKVAIPLPNVATRSFAVAVTEIIYSNNAKWIADGTTWNPIKRPTAINQLLDLELTKQFHLDYGINSNYQLLEDRDLWICVCGAINHSSESHCCRCTQALSDLRNFDIDALRRRKDARVALERAAGEKRRQEEAAAKQRNVRTAKRVAVALAAIAILCIVVYFSIGAITKNNVYNNAVSLMSQEQYEEAIAAFRTLDEYKDSKEQINSCWIAIQKENLYNKAVSLFHAKEYDDAKNIFESLGDYQDVPSYIQKLSDRQALSYSDALSYLDQGDDALAYSLFKSLADYKDSAEYLARFHYVPVTGSVTYYTIEANKQIFGSEYTIEYSCNSQGQIIHEKDTLNRQRPGGQYANLSEYDFLYDGDGNQIREVIYNEYGGSIESIEYTYDTSGNEIEYKNTYDGKTSDPVYSSTLNAEGLLEKKIIPTWQV